MKAIKKVSLSLLLAATVLSGCGSTDTKHEEPYVTEDVNIKSDRGTNIKATIVTPAEESGKEVPLVIFAHGFMGNRNESGSFTEVAEGLAEKGIASIRLDFPGCNESEESFLYYTLDNMQNDMKSVLAYAESEMKIDKNKIGLLGYSMGGRVSTLCLDKMKINTLVLWAPAVSDGLDAASFLGSEDVLNQKISESENGVSMLKIADVDLEVSTDFLVQFKNTKPTASLKKFKGNVFFIIGGSDETIVSSITDKGVAAASNTNITTVLEIPRAGHGLGSFDSDQQVRKIVVDSTVNYFSEYLK